jgi:hypothetical protein
MVPLYLEVTKVYQVSIWLKTDESDEQTNNRKEKIKN